MTGKTFRILNVVIIDIRSSTTLFFCWNPFFEYCLKIENSWLTSETLVSGMWLDFLKHSICDFRNFLIMLTFILTFLFYIWTSHNDLKKRIRLWTGNAVDIFGVRPLRNLPLHGLNKKIGIKYLCYINWILQGAQSKIKKSFWDKLSGLQGTFRPLGDSVGEVVFTWTV